MSLTTPAARTQAALPMPPAIIPSLSATQSPLALDVPVLIFGLDDKGRPHASRLSGDHAALADDAAAAMQMCACPAEAGPLRLLAEKLPQGRVFASGKAFVPFVKQALYDQIIGHLPEGVTVPERALERVRASDGAQPMPGSTATVGVSASAARQAATPQRGSIPHDFSLIKAGSVVLASVDREDGWWPAIVTEEKGDDLFELQWQDWSDWEPFLRKRERLALLHPSYTDK